MSRSRVGSARARKALRVELMNIGSRSRPPFVELPLTPHRRNELWTIPTRLRIQGSDPYCPAVPKAKSLAFSRIRAEVMAATASIPPGRVTTYSALANHLEVVPRHVAFVLASLSSAEAADLPWHRVVAQKGALRSSSAAGLRRQRERLTQEGIKVVKDQIPAFTQHFFDWPPRPDRPGIASRRKYSDPKTPPIFPTALNYGYPP